MTHSVPNLHEAQTVIVGVDTHKHMHVAVAIDNRGLRLGAHSFGADSEGYRSRQHGQNAGLASDSIGALVLREAAPDLRIGCSAAGHGAVVDKGRARHVELPRSEYRVRGGCGRHREVDPEIRTAC